VAALLAGCSTGGGPSAASSAASSTASSTPSATTTPAAACLTPEEVRTGQIDFASANGTPLQGLLVGTGSVGVVLAHQSESDLCQWRPYAYTLASKGYRALTLSMAFHLDEDVAGAVAALRARGVQHVVLIGASMGGTAVLGAATEVDPPVDAVVSLSAPARYQTVNALPLVPKLRMPTLYVVASGDTAFAEDGRALYAASPPSLRTLLVVDGAAHGVDMLTPAVTARVEAFLKAHSP